MSRYRKKPVVVDAFQMTRERMADISDWPEWLKAAARKPVRATGFLWEQEEGTVLIGTLEGVMTVQPNDWIIRGVQGELYPCKPDIFEATYEPVEDACDE